MKGILEFDLNEEQEEHLIAVHAMDWALVAWDLNAKLRDWLKYGNDFKDVTTALEAAQNALYEIMEDYGVGLHMIR